MGATILYNALSVAMMKITDKSHFLLLSELVKCLAAQYFLAELRTELRIMQKILKKKTPLYPK